MRTGRFLLLGAASMDLLKQSRDSLAGRIAYVELGPFNVLEADGDGRETLWTRGGFPDSFLATSDEASTTWRENFIRTMVISCYAFTEAAKRAAALMPPWV